MATLVYLYGPPAVGKLTVARIVAERTGFPLFHNHLSVDAVAAVFPFGSESFTRVIQPFRLGLFHEAMRSGTSLVFTNNSAWRGTDGRERFVAFVGRTRSTVEAGGGKVKFVQLHAEPEVLERRVADPSRQDHGKLRDVLRLRELLAAHDPTPLHPEDFRIDAGRVAAEDAAEIIVAALRADG